MTELTKSEAIEEVKRNVSCLNYLKKARRGKYCCPFCGSGESGSSNSDGALSVDKHNLFKCFSCNERGSVIDLYMQLHGVDFNEAFTTLAAENNITYKTYTPTSPAEDFKTTPQKATGSPQSDFSNGAGVSKAKDENGAQCKPGQQAEAQKDFTEYYKACIDNLFNSEKGAAGLKYLEGRGISALTAEDYKIGFDPQADPAAAPGQIEGAKNHPCPRLIIPTSKAHYVARSIDPNTPAAFKAVNPKDAQAGIFNAAALNNQEVKEVFVTEGIFDALSVIEAGAAAIALNSTGNYRKLLEVLEKRPTEATLILSLDNDKAGETATDELRAGLERLNISNITENIAGEHKDANEALQADKEGFMQAIAKALQKVQAKPDNVGLYMANDMLLDIARFKSDKKTGFNNLDKEAGGLYAGLYVIAAISSLGKTTFAHQIADNIAAAGEDVLYFSMEQSRLELVSKSIARTAAQLDENSDITSIGVRKYGLDSDKKRAAALAYKDKVTDKLSIIEGNFNCDIAFIRYKIKEYCRRNNARPVVFIDYLQILQPEKEGKSGVRETIDQAVTELKRISREMELTVIVISSVNRANYLTPIDFEALKESGGIEYTADVVWGLQLQCLNNDLFTKEGQVKNKRDAVRAAKTATPRKVELLCLKNRYGKSSYSCFFDYCPEKDLFKEISEAEADFTLPNAGDDNPFDNGKPILRA